MEDCIFCKIINKEVPAAVVYDDDTTLAFMNIEAINSGHLLVIPKQHITYVHEMSEGTYIKVQLVVKRLCHAVKSAFSPEKVGIMVSGWDVPHAHIHVVPMTDPSDITSKKSIDNTILRPTSKELNDQAQLIKDNL